MPYSTHSSRFNRCQTVTRRFSINDAALRLGAKVVGLMGAAVELWRGLWGGGQSAPVASIQIELQKNVSVAGTITPVGSAMIESQRPMELAETQGAVGGISIQRNATMTAAAAPKPAASLALQNHSYSVDSTDDNYVDQAGDPYLIVT